jgi:hypothetical protein
MKRAKLLVIAFTSLYLFKMTQKKTSLSSRLTALRINVAAHSNIQENEIRTKILTT